MRQQFLDFISKQVEINVEPTDQISTLGLNSLEFVKFLALIEKEFGLEIDIRDLDIAKYETIGQLLDLLIRIKEEN